MAHLCSVFCKEDKLSGVCGVVSVIRAHKVVPEDEKRLSQARTLHSKVQLAPPVLCGWHSNTSIVVARMRLKA